MIICSNCGSSNIDGEVFCENCGRPLKKLEKKKKALFIKKYVQNTDGDYIYMAGSPVGVVPKLDKKIVFPDDQILNNDRWVLIFRDQSGCNLAEYLSGTESHTIKMFIQIERQILEILREVQQENLVVGSCDLEDFFLLENDPQKMVLRIVRPLLEKKAIPVGYSIGEFAAPEVRNSNTELIGNRTDVYLSAIIFNRLIIGNKYTLGDIGSQLFWGYTLTNSVFGENSKAIRRFHTWLGTNLNMYPIKRKKNIIESLRAFDKCCELENSTTYRNIQIEDHLATNVGKLKKQSMKDTGREKSEWNEDVIEKWEKKGSNENIKAYLLADGISNSDIGTGYLAANIIKKNFLNVLNEYFDRSDHAITDETVEYIVQEIVRKSNSDIWEKVCEIELQTGNIMGSTLILLLYSAGILYTYCLGDSILYLLRDENLIPLHSPDNSGLDALKKGITYDEYRRMEMKESITVYIGGKYANTVSDCYKQRQVEKTSLSKDDIVIAASDGVLDYMKTKLSDTDWDKETSLLKILMKNEPLSLIASRIIRKDNSNGGGDNLSMILIKAGEEKNE